LFRQTLQNNQTANYLKNQQITSKLLGHTSVHTTEIYADVVMEKKADAVNLMNGIFG
jgi:site-specific recombinase XerD